MENLAEKIVPHPSLLLLLAPFIVIFVWAAWVEFRRWWLYGASGNKRANFPIDETAPSYEPPPGVADTPTKAKTETGQAND